MPIFPHRVKDGEGANSKAVNRTCPDGGALMRLRTHFLRLMTLTLGVMVGLGNASAVANEVRTTSFTEGQLRVQIDGLRVDYDPGPYLIPPGRTMIPMRAFFESLGAHVEWNQNERSVTARRGDRTVRLVIGSDLAHINGRPYVLDAVPVLRMGRTFIPLRFVAEALDTAVHYDGKQKVISISTGPEPISSLPLEQGIRMRFRLMLVDLFLTDVWSLLVETPGPVPSPITYLVSGAFGDSEIPVVRRHLEGLEAGRQFLPTLLTWEHVETAPWVSAQVYQELKEHGKSTGFLVGGFSISGHQRTDLVRTGFTTFALTFEGRRVQVPAMLAETLTGDKLWILDDPTNPFVLKFLPVGLPIPQASGTIGYQLEWVERESKD